MNERVREAVEVMLDYVRTHPEEEMEDALFFAYQHLLAAHQWRLQLNRQELDEAWEMLRAEVR
ncbi:MAG: hypothetical protein KatS3mg022_3424 [Armatimonadota bacterium]|nr:MAG: hypothetical protein KatS3mg022_1438 [Armatimonadota bacterium]GIV16011.1 MAG: hypothetical protein KatS3mg022_1446 [Armatimonadota bacterium]GIV17989.1 MAG: hypothetical protein KatS3mg022_3424 [Armatimonadota bacterium]